MEKFKKFFLGLALFAFIVAFIGGVCTGIFEENVYLTVSVAVCGLFGVPTAVRVFNFIKP